MCSSDVSLGRPNDFKAPVAAHPSGYSQSTAFRKGFRPISLIRFCLGVEARMLSVLQAKSISDCRAAAVPTGSSSRLVYWSY